MSSTYPPVSGRFVLGTTKLGTTASATVAALLFIPVLVLIESYCECVYTNWGISPLACGAAFDLNES